MEPDVMILVFWMLSFKPSFSLSSFIFIKRLFRSLLSAVSVDHKEHLKYYVYLKEYFTYFKCQATYHVFLSNAVRKILNNVNF